MARPIFRPDPVTRAVFLGSLGVITLYSCLSQLIGDEAKVFIDPIQKGFTMPEPVEIIEKNLDYRELVTIVITRHVRRNDNVFKIPQGAIGRQRLGFENVERGTRDLLLLQRLHEGGFINQRTAADVDEACTLLHRCELLRAKKSAGLVGERCCGHHIVGICENLVKISAGVYGREITIA